MNRRTQRAGTGAGDLRVHVLVLVTLLAALVVLAGFLGPTLRPGEALPEQLPASGLLPWQGAPAAEEASPPVVEEGDDVLYVPSIDLLAPIVKIELDQDAVLSPPADPDIVGWWQRSAEPGARRGQTVMTGHTVHSGGGVMNKLGDLVKGDVVRVRDEGRVIEYRVTDVATLSRDEVAENAQMLFGQDREKGRLVLVTCTDWVDGVYLSNIIVVGEVVRG
jgi:LPXTG-site transpeptidase (sortase) family protein